MPHAPSRAQHPSQGDQADLQLMARVAGKGSVECHKAQQQQEQLSGVTVTFLLLPVTQGRHSSRPSLPQRCSEAVKHFAPAVQVKHINSSPLGSL